MNAVSTMKNLKEFIKDNFDSIDECAEVLDVSRRTVENYMYVNPCGILKHSAKFVQRKDINPLELFDAVGESMEQINEQRAKQ
jgi:glutaredoxin-related protein